MTEALLIAAVLIAAVTCPAMMVWNARRGRAGCLMAGESELEKARNEQRALNERITTLIDDAGEIRQ